MWSMLRFEFSAVAIKDVTDKIPQSAYSYRNPRTARKVKWGYRETVAVQLHRSL